MDYSKVMDIIAYYLSEYDMQAFETLGYHAQNRGFEEIATVFGKKGSYLRRLRDEYDVVTNSHRLGQRNRDPRLRIIEFRNYLVQFSFEDLTDIVKSLIENGKLQDQEKYSGIGDKLTNMSEEELEYIVNFKDFDAAIKLSETASFVRFYNTSIIKQLKKLYRGKCQICGVSPFSQYSANICEAHHIEFFAHSQNNNSGNIVILCPNHHRLIHTLKPIFDPVNMAFVFPSGQVEKIVLNYHLQQEGLHHG